MAKGLITVGILAALVRLCKNVPKHIKGLIERMLFVSVQFEDHWHGPKKNAMEAAAGFIAKNQGKRRFRLLSVQYRGNKALEFNSGPQTDSGVFFVGLRPFWYSSTDAKEQGAVPRSVLITTIGYDQTLIYEYVGVKEKIEEVKRNRSYYLGDGKEWERLSPIVSTAELFLPVETKTRLDKSIDFFKNNRDWYHKRGINHKLLIIVYGPPGTGKSSISTYVANRLGWSLGTVTTSAGFSKMVRAATESNIVTSVPDVDTLGIGLKRVGVEDANTRRKRWEIEKNEEATAENAIHSDETDKEKEEHKEEVEEANISKIAEVFNSDRLLNETLNLFQGDIPLNDSVVIMSTNCLEELDPALLRSSRCDLLLEIGPLSESEIQSFVNHYYETDEKLPSFFEGSYIVASDLMGAFTDNPFDKEAFLQVIETKVWKKKG